MAADMLVAYYEQEEDTSNIFNTLQISKSETYKEHLNKYDVIKVNNLKKINSWYKMKILSIFKDHLDFYYNKFDENIPYPILKIRSMKTRWGVCNRKVNSVTLNLNLVKYDSSCLDYVIIHELSHFVHFNHSKSFWNTVSKYCPNYKEIEKKLKN